MSRFLELAQLLQNQEATDDSIMVQYQVLLSQRFSTSVAVVEVWVRKCHYLLQVQGSYDHELSQLQDTFQSIIVHLLSDSVSKCRQYWVASC